MSSYLCQFFFFFSEKLIPDMFLLSENLGGLFSEAKLSLIISMLKVFRLLELFSPPQQDCFWVVGDYLLQKKVIENC